MTDRYTKVEQKFLCDVTFAILQATNSCHVEAAENALQLLNSLKAHGISFDPDQADEVNIVIERAIKENPNSQVSRALNQNLSTERRRK